MQQWKHMSNLKSIHPFKPFMSRVPDPKGDVWSPIYTVLRFRSEAALPMVQGVCVAHKRSGVRRASRDFQVGLYSEDFFVEADAEVKVDVEKIVGNL